MEQTNGSIIGGCTTLCAIITNIIPVESAVQSAICAGIGAGVGFIVTYALKKLALWVESKFSDK